MSYSTELRKRVIGYITAGNSQKVAADTFSISTTTVSRWWSIYQKDGRVAPRPRGGSVGKVCKKALIEFVDKHPDKTLKQIGEHFGVKGPSIWRLLKNLGYSRKKNVHLLIGAKQRAGD